MKRDGSLAMTGPIDLKNNNITNPALQNPAATKQYVDQICTTSQDIFVPISNNGYEVTTSSV